MSFAQSPGTATVGVVSGEASTSLSIFKGDGTVSYLQCLKVPNCPPGLLLPKKWKQTLFPSQSLQAGDGEAASLVHLL